MSEITWDEAKRRANIRKHGIDFAGCESIWDGFTVTREDARRAYLEQRLVTFGMLGLQVVVLVHTERWQGMHVISLRKADRYEARYYLEKAEEFQGGQS